MISKALAKLFTILLVIVPVAPLAVRETFVPLTVTRSPPSPMFEMPFEEKVPVTVKALLTVVVPLDDPIFTDVASPPIFSVEATVLKRLAVA